MVPLLSAACGGGELTRLLRCGPGWHPFPSCQLPGTSRCRDSGRLGSPQGLNQLLHFASNGPIVQRDKASGRTFQRLPRCKATPWTTGVAMGGCRPPRAGAVSLTRCWPCPVWMRGAGVRKPIPAAHPAPVLNHFCIICYAGLVSPPQGDGFDWVSHRNSLMAKTGLTDRVQHWCDQTTLFITVCDTGAPEDPQ